MCAESREGVVAYQRWLGSSAFERRSRSAVARLGRARDDRLDDACLAIDDDQVADLERAVTSEPSGCDHGVVVAELVQVGDRGHATCSLERDRQAERVQPSSVRTTRTLGCAHPRVLVQGEVRSPTPGLTPARIREVRSRFPCRDDETTPWRSQIGTRVRYVVSITRYTNKAL